MLWLTKDRALALAMLILAGIMLVESGNIKPPTSWQGGLKFQAQHY